MSEEKTMTPEDWETSVKQNIIEYIDSFLSISKGCNMGTMYSHPVVTEFETHTEYDTNKINGAELRIVFDFVGPVDKDKMNFT